MLALPYRWILTYCLSLVALLLGRLRMDLEQCKEIYLRVAQQVFESDKTIGGLPYRKTLYKASKLEYCLKEMMRDAAVKDPSIVSDYSESIRSPTALSPMSPRSAWSNSDRSGGYDSSNDNSIREETSSQYKEDPHGNIMWFDSRPERCKT